MPSTHRATRPSTRTRARRAVVPLAVAAVALLLPACRPVPPAGAGAPTPPAATAAPTASPAPGVTTGAPTPEPTPDPAPEPTEAPTPAVGTPTASPTPRPTASAAPTAPPRDVALPDPGSRFEYQIGGADTPAAGTQVVIRDSTEQPSGLYDICYVNGFQTQPGDTERLIRTEPELVLHHDGRPLRDDGWPDEVLYDIRRPEIRARVAERIGSIIDDCAARGFDAVEVDNLDSYTRSLGLVTPAHTLAYATLLVERAHAAGLAFAQKNTAELVTEVRALGADLVVSEECSEWDECDVYTSVYPVVLDVEYDRSAFQAACRAQSAPATRLPELSVVLRDRDVSRRGTSGAVHETC